MAVLGLKGGLGYNRCRCGALSATRERPKMPFGLGTDLHPSVLGAATFGCSGEPASSQ